jgi:hypothetical protein
MIPRSPKIAKTHALANSDRRPRKNGKRKRAIGELDSMPKYTQANRPLTIRALLGQDVLLLSGLRGYEGISQLLNYQVDLLAKKVRLPVKMVAARMALPKCL